MDSTADIDQWAESEDLTPETLRVLKEEAFDSLEKLSELTSAEIDTLFTNTNLLKKQQCLRLKKAVEKLNTETSQGQTMAPRPVVSTAAKIRFVLVGKVGVGKSSTGNTMLGAEKFISRTGFQPGTFKCETHREVDLGQNVEVVDTPGLCNMRVKEEETAQVIAKGVACMDPGPDAFLFIVNISRRFSQEDAGVYKQLVAIFGECVTKHMIVVFTGGDLLGPDDIISDLNRPPPGLRSILEACENRCVVFNNMSTDRRQVGRLLNIARNLMQQNDNQSYRFEKSLFVESEIERLCKQLQEKFKILVRKDLLSWDQMVTFQYTGTSHTDFDTH